MAMRVVAHYSWPQSLTCFLMPPPRTPPLKGNINFCWSCSWIPHLDVASVERSFPWLERLFAADLVACLSVMRWAHSTFSDISIYKAQNLRITPSIAFYIRPKNTHTQQSSERKPERREEKTPFSRFPFWQHSLWCDSIKVKYNFAFLCRRLYIEFDLEELLPLQSTTVLRLHTLPRHTAPALCMARQAGTRGKWNRFGLTWQPSAF